jgi:hypothetical protein
MGRIFESQQDMALEDGFPPMFEDHWFKLCSIVYYNLLTALATTRRRGLGAHVFVTEMSLLLQETKITGNSG